MSAAPTDLICPRRAARLLGCHISTIYRFVMRGRLRAWRRAGSRYLVSEADVRALVQPVLVKVEDTVRTESEAEGEALASLERLRGKGYRV